MCCEKIKLFVVTQVHVSAFRQSVDLIQKGKGHICNKFSTANQLLNFVRAREKSVVIIILSWPFQVFFIGSLKLVKYFWPFLLVFDLETSIVLYYFLWIISYLAESEELKHYVTMTPNKIRFTSFMWHHDLFVWYWVWTGTSWR